MKSVFSRERVKRDKLIENKFEHALGTLWNDLGARMIATGKRQNFARNKTM